ncbi:MAG: tetratricopeptide repeat protein [Candidatus Eisenbacteria bacterium]|nr:tetratricopeptide repeat protein [Candidatus Latescibacterota bacterium]MBD3302351.1 tetratricopeptide repeat protein [Candidatus Eisenbacteria bacterium]
MDAEDGRLGRPAPSHRVGSEPPAEPTAEPAGFGKALALGDMQMLADDFQSALESYDRALALVGSDPVWRRERAEARLHIAECHRKRGEYQEALAQLSRIRQEIDPGIDQDLAAKVTGRTGMVQQSLGEYLIAETNCRKAYDAVRGGSDNEEIGLLELTLGNISYRLGQVDRAREWYESALFTFRRIDHREGIARALNNLGVLLKVGSRWREAIDYFERALSVSEEAGNTPRIASHSLNLGVLLTKSCEWTRALQVLSRALLTFRETGNAAGMTKTHLALGNLKLRLGQTKVAASHYDQALDLARSHGYRREEVLALEFQGELALQQGKGREARRILDDALRRGETVAPEGDLVCEVKRRLAEEAIRRSDLVAATRWATEAAWIASRIHNQCELGVSLRILGEAAGEGGRTDAAIRFLEQSADALIGTPDLYEETVTRIRLAAVLVATAGRPESEGDLAARRGLEILSPVPDRIRDLDLYGLIPESIEVRARALVSLGDLEGALRVLDRGIEQIEETGSGDGRPRLDALRSELVENQAECVLASTEEYRILQDFSPLDPSMVRGAGGVQQLLDQLAGRVRVDGVLLATGPKATKLRVDAAVGLDRPAAMLRGLEPVLDAFAAGRAVWLTGSPAEDPRLDRINEPWALEGPLVALRLRPGEGIWGVLAAGRKDRKDSFSPRELRLLSLYGSLLSVAIESRRQAIVEAGDSAVSPEGEDDAFSEFLTADTAMRQTLGLLRRIAPSDATVLLRGETGTGKGLLAECIHKASRRREKPFIQVNCAALPEQLLESERFGHRKGSFTGAIRDKRGLVEEAEGGTLFLDEVDRCHRDVQAKLLQVLDRREFRPVGGLQAKKADVRILCATNTDLAAAIREGRFLEDLYYRLNDFTVAIPALRDRREDIPLLVRHFLARFVREMDRRPAGIGREVLRRLMDHDWRGNIRELEKCVRRLVVLSEDGEWISLDLLPPELQAEVVAKENGSTLREAVQRLEADLIRRTLQEVGGNKSETSRRLRISYPSLLEKIRRYGLEAFASRKKANRPS